MSSRGTWPVLVWILFLSTAALAQTSGSIRGEVKDPEGQPLAGATITVSSEALIGKTRTTNTNELGVFRFPSLPVGDYKVDAALEGFESIVVDQVAVNLGSTANVPLSIKIKTVAESLSVVGDTPLLDVNQSGLSTSYKKEMLNEVPTQRHMWDLMQQAPGVTVDPGDGQPWTIAFGSGMQSHSWNIDGVDVTNPETGQAWWYVNPDVIEEIQVLGVGAPAEYGNFTGAAFNVVTKKGGNDFHGTANYFLQTPGLTGVNVRLADSPFTFNRDKYYDLTGQIGGPLRKDRISFFGAVEIWRDASTPPGIDSNFAPLNRSNKYDFKVTTRLGKKHELTGFFHHENYTYLDASQYVAASAAGEYVGHNPAWGGSFTSTLNDDVFLELNYSGWWADELYVSQTGSLEDRFIDYNQSPAPVSTGGLAYPYDYVVYRHQVKAKATYYADRFLKSEHEFRFGVQYSHGSADTMAGIGANGLYTYRYYGNLYQNQQDPYHYGAISDELGFFVDDTVRVNEKLTLNLGVRYDRNRGSIPDYPRLANGTPSISPVANWIKTGEAIPGIGDFIRWNTTSPRFGFVWQPKGDGRSIIEGSFGVYYDHDVSWNWETPPPEVPILRTFLFNPETGQFDILLNEQLNKVGFNPDIKPPRTNQYSAGYEQQLTTQSAIGVQYVYKDTRDLIGWEILAGAYQTYPFVDPFTGREFTLLNITEDPLLRKGNDPGDFPGSEGLDYFQKYHGVILTYNTRITDRTLLAASYTWSRSYGLIPRMLSPFQSPPVFGRGDGDDPNHFINAEGRLQGDRPHMFRVHTVFYKLPWDLTASASVEFSSGRAHNRQIRVSDPNGRPHTVIMEPDGSFRHSPIQNIDLSIGKRFDIGGGARLRIDGQIFNLLNSNQELSFATLRLQNPGETFVPDAWVKPRRLQVRIGLEF